MAKTKLLLAGLLALVLAPVAALAADGEEEEALRMTIDELRAAERRGEDVVVVDSRAERSFNADDIIAQGAVRLPPDDPVRAATQLRLSQHATLVVYCA